MSSKKVSLVVLMAFILSACSERTIPRHENPTSESQTQAQDKSGPETDDRWSNSFSEQHKQMSQKIKSATEHDLVTVMDFLKNEIFSDRALDPNIYQTGRFARSIGLYGDWLMEVDKQSGNSVLTHLKKDSLDLFRKYYVTPCASSELNDCGRIQIILQNESGSVDIILQSLVSITDNTQKLKILGMAYDISRSNGLRHPRLEKEYETSLIFLFFNNNGQAAELLSQNIRLQHFRNLEFLLKLKDWQNPREEDLEILKKIKPWLLNADNRPLIKKFREILIGDIYLYYDKIEEIESDLQIVLTTSLANMKADKVKLKDYPAFDDIDIEQLKEGSALMSLVVLGVYYRDISLPQANQIYNGSPNKAFFLKEFWEKSRLLTRWDMAQLGIESTGFLSELLNKQPNKTAEYIQSVLDQSAELNQPWNIFHNQRAANLFNFLDAHRDDTPLVKAKDVEDYFNSFDRNIMKTIIYPNMFAFILAMSETQWNGSLNFHFKRDFIVDSSLLFDRLVTGDFWFPWFTFTNLNGKWTYSDTTRNTLFRSEIMDALYYFITTKTYKSYNIEIDNFLNKMALSLLRDRQETLEAVLQAQQRLYFNDGTVANEFIQWCQGIDPDNSKTPVKERLSFYDLKHRVTPFSDPLKFIEASSTQINANLDFYFFDKYSHVGNLRGKALDEAIDQYRVVYLPILNFLKKSEQLVSALRLKNPQLGIEDIDTFKQRLKNLENLSKAFSGSQIELAGRMKDCKFIAAMESKRRIQNIAFYEKEYFKTVVHPILMKLSRGEISSDEASLRLARFHKDSPAFIDQITVDQQGRPTLIASYNAFAVRTMQYLTQGINYNHEGIRLQRDPIVGDDLIVSMPPNLGSDTYVNPFIGHRLPEKNRRPFHFDSNSSPDEFAKNAVADIMDSQRGGDFRTKLTAWDINDTYTYISGLQPTVSFYVSFSQLGKFEHLDYSKPECRGWRTEIDKDCLIESEVPVEEVATIMNQYFNQIELDETDLEYMELIEEDGYYTHEYMDTLAYYDKALLRNGDYYKNGRYFHRELSGFFDLAYQLYSEDFIGDFFKTYYDITTQKIQPSACSPYYRKACRWSWEVGRALDFYASRSERQKQFIFKFDQSLLVNNWKEVRDEAIKKLSYPLMIRENAEKWMNKQRKGKSNSLMTGATRPAYELVPLRIKFSQSIDPLEDFLETQTGGFFEEEPNWQEEYFKWNSSSTGTLTPGP